MYNVGMILVYRLKCYSLEMFPVCINVMMYLKCTFISAFLWRCSPRFREPINPVKCHRTCVIHSFSDPLGSLQLVPVTRIE